MHERGTTPAVVAALCVFASACAPTMPSWSGARTTPSGRLDLAAGAAIRVPVGELSPRDPTTTEPRQRTLALMAAGGVSPGASARVGLGDAADLGIRVIGATAQVGLRSAVTLDDERTVRLMLGIAPFAGLLADHENGNGWRAGVELPVTLGWEIGGLYEIAFGVRAAGEHLRGDVGAVGGPTSALEAWHWRVGAVLGVGVGFRRLFAFVELAADYEWLVATLDGADSGAAGISLTPAFALRWRL